VGNLQCSIRNPETGGCDWSQQHLRVMEIEEIKSVPCAPLSHPFVERLIGTIWREYLDRVFFWNAQTLGAQAEQIQRLLQCSSRSLRPPWHDTRTMRRRIVGGAHLACLSCLATTLPWSVSDSGSCFTKISPPTGLIQAEFWQPQPLSNKQERVFNACGHYFSNLNDATKTSKSAKSLWLRT
jgi:hypothetical protein